MTGRLLWGINKQLVNMIGLAVPSRRKRKRSRASMLKRATNYMRKIVHARDVFVVARRILWRLPAALLPKFVVGHFGISAELSHP